MLNINELEQRWLRYKIKSYTPHAIISLSLVVIVIFILFLTNDTQDIAVSKMAVQKSQKSPVVQKVSVKKEKIKEEPKKVQVALQAIKNPSKSTTLSTKMTITPSLDFMKKMQDNTLSHYEYNTQVAVSPKPKKIFKKQAPQKVQKEPIIEAPEQEIVSIQKQETLVRINRQNTHDDIAQVIRRFNKNNNPALSLFIAKKYYELGDYHKSYNYALITNEINRNIEASWIVFAKSLVKLNEKDMAVKTLQTYVSQSNSNRANILLDDITSGKFK